MSIADDAASVLRYLKGNVDQRRHKVEIGAATGLRYTSVSRALNYLRDNNLLHDNDASYSLVSDKGGVMLTLAFGDSQRYHHARVQTGHTQMRRDFIANVRPLLARRPDLAATIGRRLEIDYQRLMQDVEMFAAAL